jgi:hypothetical protein
VALGIAAILLAGALGRGVHPFPTEVLGQQQLDVHGERRLLVVDGDDDVDQAVVDRAHEPDRNGRG